MRLPNKKMLVIVTVLIVLFIVLAVLIIAFIIKNQENSSIDLPISAPVSAYIDNESDTVPHDLSEFNKLNRSLYESISSKFEIQSVGDCESALTNSTFPDVEMKYNSCEWTPNISDKMDIELSAMAIYVNTNVVFRNKLTNYAIAVKFFYPGVFEYNGGPDCGVDNQTLQQINGNIYKYIYHYEYQDQIVTVTEYLSQQRVIKPDNQDFNLAVSYAMRSNFPLKACVQQGPSFLIKAQYSEEETKLWEKIRSTHTFMEAPSAILAYIYVDKNTPTQVADDLITGFKL